MMSTGKYILTTMAMVTSQIQVKKPMILVVRVVAPFLGQSLYLLVQA